MPGLAECFSLNWRANAHYIREMSPYLHPSTKKSNCFSYIPNQRLIFCLLVLPCHSFPSQVMAVRVKALIAVILSTAFVFLTLSAFLPTKDHSSNFEFVISSSNDKESAITGFKADKLPTGEILSFVGLNNHVHGPAPFSSPPPASPGSDWDPLAQSIQDQKIPASKENMHHATYEILDESHSRSDDFRLLIGVMTPYWSSSRRHIIRNAYNRFHSDLPVDVFFVQGDPNSWNERNEDKVWSTFHTGMEWENQTFHDILHVSCEENFEEGKTYEYFKKVGREFSNKYTHVMKTDDDSFVNIPGTNHAIVLFINYI